MPALRFSLAIITALCAAATCSATEPQSLSAQIGEIAFVSDDDSILLVPVPTGGTFTLTASTKGASAYPPPKTRVDRLSISCTLYTPGQAKIYSNADFSPNHCRVSFAKGTPPMGGEPEAEYTLDKGSADNHFEISAASAKTIEGSFQFRLKDAHGASLMISNGHFKAEDRQL
ncbi:MAG: hypothetical protein ABI411_21025 [Tahibacter sp.]